MLKVVGIALVWGIWGVAGSICKEPTKNLVTLQDLEEKVDGLDWIQIYLFENQSTQVYGKCNVRWNVPPDSDNFIRRQLRCFNFNLNGCEDFERAVKRSTDECGRAEESAENSTMDAKFYSQDITKHIWYDSCYEFDEITGTCTVRYHDLLVKKNRVLETPNQELDLYQLPWDKISEDLVNNFDLTITNILIRFTWIGYECWYDSRGRQRGNSSHILKSAHYKAGPRRQFTHPQDIKYS